MFEPNSLSQGIGILFFGGVFSAIIKVVGAKA